MLCVSIYSDLHFSSGWSPSNCLVILYPSDTYKLNDTLRKKVEQTKVIYLRKRNMKPVENMHHGLDLV